VAVSKITKKSSLALILAWYQFTVLLISEWKKEFGDPTRPVKNKIACRSSRSTGWQPTGQSVLFGDSFFCIWNNYNFRTR